MAVVTILRDTPNNASIVRMTATDTMATLVTHDYILNQMPTIRALNNGFWQWYVTDFIYCSCSDGNALFEFTDDTFSTLEQYGAQPGGGVNPGLANDVAYYATNGSNISPIATANNSVLVTNGSGVPSMSTTLPSGLIIPGYYPFSWIDVAISAEAMVPNNGYVTDNGATLVTYTLPTVAAFGTVMAIQGKSAGLFTIHQNAGQQIIFGDVATTVGVGGSLSSTLQYDFIQLLCITANTLWVVTDAVGNITYV